VYFVVVTGLQARAARFLGRHAGARSTPTPVGDAVDG
jgi:hypothetical protein